MPESCPSVSVALCTYNGALYLRQQLHSLSAQTHLPDELVVCDDCSNDGTRAILQEFAAEARFHVRLHMNDRNLGFVQNFAKAISQCQGEVIFLCDQDDVWHPEKISKVLNRFALGRDCAVVVTDAEVVDADLQPLGYTLWQAVGFDSVAVRKKFQHTPSRLLIKRNVVTGATTAFRSSFRSDLLPIPGTWTHDAWIALILSFLGRIELLTERLIQYRQHGHNQIGGRKKSLLELASQAASDELLRLAAQAENCRLAHARLNRIQRPLRDRKMLSELLRKEAHLLIRAGLQERRFLGMQAVLGQLMRCNYHRYSCGWASVAKDFFLILRGSKC